MKLLVKTTVGIIVNIAIMLAVIFGLSGSWEWQAGWIFFVLYILMLTATMIPLLQNKKLLKERLKPLIQKGQNKIDKIIVSIFLLFMYGWFIIMPLEFRYQWNAAFPDWLVLIGIIGFLIADILLYFVFKQNSFLIAIVKKQKNQKVVSDGLYSVVRHPMYMAIVLLMLSGSLVLSSLSGLLVFLCASITLYIRIIFEEKLLEKELTGYTDYKKKVTKRLIPFLI